MKNFKSNHSAEKKNRKKEGATDEELQDSALMKFLLLMTEFKELILIVLTGAVI